VLPGAIHGMLIAAPLVVAIGAYAVLIVCSAIGVDHTKSPFVEVILGTLAVSVLVGWGAVGLARVFPWWLRLVVAIGYLPLAMFTLLVSGF
jgi:hypothetical protein